MWTAKEHVRVLVVVDAEDFRAVLRTVLGWDSRFSIVGEVASGGEALTILREAAPDVIVLEQDMAGMTGIETAHEILMRWPQQRIVLASARDDQLWAEARAVGVDVCVDKVELVAMLCDTVFAAGVRSLRDFRGPVPEVP